MTLITDIPVSNSHQVKENNTICVFSGLNVSIKEVPL